jgi:hypothetical protein
MWHVDILLHRLNLELLKDIRVCGNSCPSHHNFRALSASNRHAWALIFGEGKRTLANFSSIQSTELSAPKQQNDRTLACEVVKSEVGQRDAIDAGVEHKGRADACGAATSAIDFQNSIASRSIQPS